MTSSSPSTRAPSPAPAPRPDHFGFFALGGSALAFCAGMVNVLTMLSPFHLPGTHMTGTITHIAAAWVEGEPAHLPLLLGAVTAFLGGAMISGASISSTRLAIGRGYGWILILESMLLAVAAGFLEVESAAGLVLCAGASGLQNALATQFSSAVVRTTHVTGIVTDLGIALGSWVARRGIAWWRAGLFAALLLGFGAGAVVGALAHASLGSRALGVPALVLLALGVGDAFWIARRRAA